MDVDGLDAAKPGHVSTHHHGVLFVLCRHDLKLMRDLNGWAPLAEEVLRRRKDRSEGGRGRGYLLPKTQVPAVGCFPQILINKVHPDSPTEQTPGMHKWAWQPPAWNPLHTEKMRTQHRTRGNAEEAQLRVGGSPEEPPLGPSGRRCASRQGEGTPGPGGTQGASV